MSEDEKFAIIIPSEADLTAPIAAGSEYSKIYIKAMNKVVQLTEQTRVVTGTDAEGNEIISITDHPDLKWWFNQARLIIGDVAKLTANVQQKDIENKINIANLIMKSGQLTKEQQEAIIKASLEKK